MIKPCEYNHRVTALPHEVSAPQDQQADGTKYPGESMAHVPGDKQPGQVRATLVAV